MSRKMSSSSRGIEGLGLEDYNDEILMEILIRLPLQSIFRSKCVSKRWYRLISDPFFRINVVNRNPITSFLGFIESPPSYTAFYGSIWRFIAIPPQSQSQSQSPSAEETVIINSMKSSFDDVFYESNLYFISSSNGLFLCYVRSKKPNFYLMKTYHIFNPLSKICYQLPLSPKQQQAFNQWQPDSENEEVPYYKPSVGLVVNDKYDTYKVVRVEALIMKQMVEIETFSSDTGEWELYTVSVSPQIHNNLLKLQERRHEATVMKGVIHWMRKDSFNWIITYDPYSSSSSSSSTSSSTSVGHGHGLNMIPPPPLAFYKYICMGESTDGLLQVVLVHALDHHVHIGVWVFRSNGCEEWSFRYRMPPLPRQYFPRTLLGFHPHNPNTLFVEINGCVFVYHLNNPHDTATATATATPTTQVMEPFLQLPHGNTQGTVIHIILQPYTLPPWHISPLPLPLLKRTAS